MCERNRVKNTADRVSNKAISTKLADNSLPADPHTYKNLGCTPLQYHNETQPVWQA